MLALPPHCQMSDYSSLGREREGEGARRIYMMVVMKNSREIRSRVAKNVSSLLLDPLSFGTSKRK